MNRSAIVLGLSMVAGVLALTAARDASACGGCFHPPTQVASDITDERMLLSVSTQQTTLYDQIRYSGNPASFAWVLPIHGTVDVGLSADVLFGSMDTLTATQITAPPANCPAPPSDCTGPNGSGSFNAPQASAGADDAEKGGVTVTKQENVGPYATAQLHPTSTTDPAALTDWLTENGFAIPDDVKAVISQYVAEGFDFLAMKLLPNAGIQAMRPVRVTAPGASLQLPLRMAAIGTGASVGITLWVVSDGRYEPQNFPLYHIEDKDLVWDWSTSSSNYTTLRAQNEATLQGKGWELESSLTLNQTLITNVIQSGGQYYGGGGGVSNAPQAPAEDDYLAVEPSDGGTDGGPSPQPKSAAQVRDADVAALFAGMAVPNVRVTRMRSDISHAAMSTDFILKASTDQSELSNVRTVTKDVNLTCPIYNGCQVVGQGPPGATPSSTTSSSSASSFACVTSSKSTSSTDYRLAGIGGLLGLAMVFVRSRRAAKRKAS